jgi:hypothetical protein
MSDHSLDAISADVRAWYDQYLDTFTCLAASELSNVEALLAYFGVPLVIITTDRYLVLPTREAVLATAQTLIDRLRQANYASSTVHRLEVHPLNARAAFVDGDFSRPSISRRERTRAGGLPPSSSPRPSEVPGDGRSIRKASLIPRIRRRPK